MACTSCREKRMHKQINGRNLLLGKYVPFYQVTPILQKHNIKYSYVRSSGIAFLRVCMCELTQALVNDLQKLKTSGLGLPIMYY